MKYFIGIQIPIKYKTKIEMLRAECRFFTTEPHITLVPPPALPNDDIFINKVINICNKTKPFQIELNKLGQFGNRVLFVNVNSPNLIDLHESIYKGLNIQKENREFVPHLTIAKQRPKKHIDINAINERAGKVLSPYLNFKLKSIVIYYQPKERSIYLPYMQIPFNF